MNRHIINDDALMFDFDSLQQRLAALPHALNTKTGSFETRVSRRDHCEQPESDGIEPRDTPIAIEAPSARRAGLPPAERAALAASGTRRLLREVIAR